MSTSPGAHLHRVTTGRRKWPQLAILALDNQTQFEELAARSKAPTERISHLKKLICRGAQGATNGSGASGVIIDARYGREALLAATGTGIWLARPIDECLHPGREPEAALALRSWPMEHVLKLCLNDYLAPGSALKQDHEARLRSLFDVCLGTGHELMVDFIFRHDGRSDARVTTEALVLVYRLGINPDWWHLPAPGDGSDWRSWTDTIRAHDPHCRGILIRCHTGEDKIAPSSTSAVSGPLARGFSIGESLYMDVANGWFLGALDDARVVNAISERFARMIKKWEARHEAS